MMSAWMFPGAPVSFASRTRGHMGHLNHERAGETFSPYPHFDSQTSGGIAGTPMANQQRCGATPRRPTERRRRKGRLACASVIGAGQFPIRASRLPNKELCAVLASPNRSIVERLTEKVLPISASKSPGTRREYQGFPNGGCGFDSGQPPMYLNGIVRPRDLLAAGYLWIVL